LKTAIIGIGNILFKDEGVGVYAAAYLKENFNIDADIVDGGTLGFKLMRYYQEYDKVIIADTISIEDEPGSIYNIPSDELLGLGTYKKTAHEVEVVEMLEICSLLENIAKVNIVGVVPKDIESVDIDLSDILKSRFSFLIDEILKELSRDGVEYHKKEREKGLEEIIFSYANPTMKEIDGFKV
jgi:hydrogenase maturation protease